MSVVVTVYFLKHEKSSDPSKRVLERDDTSSEGSTDPSSSLLALTSIGKKYFHYKAIESDSSSEEELEL